MDRWTSIVVESGRMLVIRTDHNAERSSLKVSAPCDRKIARDNDDLLSEIKILKSERLQLAQEYDPNCEHYDFQDQLKAMAAAAETVEAVQDLAIFLGRDPEGNGRGHIEEALYRLRQLEELQ